MKTTTATTTTNRTEIFIFIVCILLSQFLCMCWCACLLNSFFSVLFFCFITSFHSLIIIVYRYERYSEAYVIRLDMTCLQRNDAQVLLLSIALSLFPSRFLVLIRFSCLFRFIRKWFFFSCSRLLLLYIHSSAHWCCCCTHTIFRRQLVYFDLNCIDAQIISYLQYIFKRNEEIKREREKKSKNEFR